MFLRCLLALALTLGSWTAAGSDPFPANYNLLLQVPLEDAPVAFPDGTFGALPAASFLPGRHLSYDVSSRTLLFTAYPSLLGKAGMVDWTGQADSAVDMGSMLKMASDKGRTYPDHQPLIVRIAEFPAPAIPPVGPMVWLPVGTEMAVEKVDYLLGIQPLYFLVHPATSIFADTFEGAGAN